MNLYLISQSINTGYDTSDSAVVAAESEEAARYTHPFGEAAWWKENEWSSGEWAAPDQVQVKFLGIAHPSIKAGVICASFNAG